MNKDLKNYIGLSGVDQTENKRAVRFGHLFSYLILIVLLIVLIQLVMVFIDGKPFYDIRISAIVWLAFSIEFMVSLYLVHDKKRYIKGNWMNLLIIVLTVPWIPWGGNWAAIFRVLRLLLFIKVFITVFKDIFLVLKSHGLGLILMVAIFFIVASGAIFSLIEGVSFSSGLWYSLVTITTVGYGDIVPLTEKGRIFGAFLLVFGVILFSIIIANISAFLVESEQKKMECHFLDMEKTIENRIEEASQKHDAKIEEMMLEMDKRLEKMEKKVDDVHKSITKKAR